MGSDGIAPLPDAPALLYPDTRVKARNRGFEVPARSVTPWCDLKKLTQTCRPDVIWSRKPVPLELCGETFSLEELRAHLKETLDIGQDCFVEFVYRDTTSLTAEMVDRNSTACAMIRELTGHPEGRRG